MPQWHSQLSVRRLVSAQAMISVSSEGSGRGGDPSVLTHIVFGGWQDSVLGSLLDWGLDSLQLLTRGLSQFLKMWGSPWELTTQLLTLLKEREREWKNERGQARLKPQTPWNLISELTSHHFLPHFVPRKSLGLALTQEEETTQGHENQESKNR